MVGAKVRTCSDFSSGGGGGFRASSWRVGGILFFCVFFFFTIFWSKCWACSDPSSGGLQGFLLWGVLLFFKFFKDYFSSFFSSRVLFQFFIYVLFKARSRFFLPNFFSFRAGICLSHSPSLGCHGSPPPPRKGSCFFRYIILYVSNVVKCPQFWSSLKSGFSVSTCFKKYIGHLHHYIRCNRIKPVNAFTNHYYPYLRKYFMMKFSRFKKSVKYFLHRFKDFCYFLLLTMNLLKWCG